MSKSISAYRKGVGMVIRNSQNHYFLGRRINKGIEAWQMPQGGIEEGEDLLQALKRELYEETGIQSIQVLQQTQEWLTYDLPAAIVPLVWDGKYQGQQQQWFLLQFTGTDTEINLRITPEPEFDQWKWAPVCEIMEQIVDFKKDLYTHIFKEFGL